MQPNELGIFARSEKGDWPLPAYDELKVIDDISWLKVLSLLRKTGLKAMTWEKFELSTRARNALVKNDILNVWDASVLSTQKINKAPGLGVKVKDEVYAIVKRETGFLLGNWHDV